jgi:hypothetical protein
MKKGPSLWGLWHSLVVSVLDHLLQHSTPCLVEAIEVQPEQDLHLLRSQHLHLSLNVFRNCIIVALL